MLCTSPVSCWPSPVGCAQAPSHGVGPPPCGPVDHTVSSDLPPTLQRWGAARGQVPASNAGLGNTLPFPGPYPPLDQNRGGGVRRHRDEAWRLSRNWNPKKKKARISWVCLYLPAVLEPALFLFWQGGRAQAWQGRGAWEASTNIPASLPPLPSMNALVHLQSLCPTGWKGPDPGEGDNTMPCLHPLQPRLHPLADPHRDTQRCLALLPGDPA